MSYLVQLCLVLFIMFIVYESLTNSDDTKNNPSEPSTSLTSSTSSAPSDQNCPPGCCGQPTQQNCGIDLAIGWVRGCDNKLYSNSCLASKVGVLTYELATVISIEDHPVFEIDISSLMATDHSSCVLLTGPTRVSMMRGAENEPIYGTQWTYNREGYCFKITIEKNHRSMTLNDALLSVSSIPVEYLAGLEIVSDSGPEPEDGLSYYNSLGDRSIRGHGSRYYLNLVDNDIGILLHEFGHAIEQEVSHYENDQQSGKTVLYRWLDHINNDGISVSTYGNNNTWEDLAEFAKYYGICKMSGNLDFLKQKSPERFKEWEYCLNMVNSTFRNSHCSS